MNGMDVACYSRLAQANEIFRISKIRFLTQRILTIKRLAHKKKMNKNLNNTMKILIFLKNYKRLEKI